VAADLTVLFPVGPRDRASLWARDRRGPAAAAWCRGRSSRSSARARSRRGYDDLRVVGLRIDPCFMHNWGTATCQPQVRLVLQPLDGTGAIGDDALHAIYNLDGAELDQLLDGLRVVAAAGAGARGRAARREPGAARPGASTAPTASCCGGADHHHDRPA
jgi:hypothetical protein